MTNTSFKGALAGLKVLDFGHYYAGPLAAMLLADQGADVVHVTAPGKKELPEQQYRLFNRNKKLLELDLKSVEGKAQALALIKSADVLIENFRPGVMKRLGLDYASVKQVNPGLVYLSLPGFASTDEERRHIQAWEGVVGAAAGIFTHASKIRQKLGYDPVYSWVPQCSIYAGYNGVLGVMAALVAREEHGHGTVIEVPLAEAGVLGHILEIWNWNKPLDKPAELPAVFDPLRYKAGDSEAVQMEKLAEAHLYVWYSPIGSYYPCADGRIIFIYNLYPNPGRYARRVVQAMGIERQLKEEGFVCTTPWEMDLPNNISAGQSLSPERMHRLRQIMADVLKTKPALEWEDIFAEAQVAATVIRTREEWLAVLPMLDSGVFTKMGSGEKELTLPGRVADMSGPGDTLNESEFREPEPASFESAQVLFDDKSVFKKPKEGHGSQNKGDLLKGLKVLELTNMVAGPLAGVFLAEYGAEIIKTDSPESPGPAAAARGEFLQHGKLSLLNDMTTAPGRKVFEKLVSQVDLVIHNVLDDTAKRLGVAHDQLTEINPNVVSAQISSFGGEKRGYWELRPGFDNLVQASTGLMAQFGTLECPQDHGGIASSDIPGGMMLAFSSLLGLYQQRKTGYAGEGRSSLARVCSYYQLPFMIADSAGKSDWGEPGGQFAVGESFYQRLYKCADGWLYVGAKEAEAGKLAEIVTGSQSVTEADIEAAMKVHPCAHWQERLVAADIGCHKTLTLQEMYQARRRDVYEAEEVAETATASTEFLHWPQHPYGVPVTLLAPSYVRVGEQQSWHRLHTGPRMGEHTVQILSELGYTDDEIRELINIRVAHEYFPAFGGKDVFYFQPPAPITEMKKAAE